MRKARDASILALADDLVAVLGGMRGAAMKIGQLMAVIDLGITGTRAREEFAERLAPLFSTAPRWNHAGMMAQLDRELGAARSRIVHLDEVPIAAASIGQVYRGVLDDGRVVAVKTQYPKVDKMVRADLKNMRLLMKVMSRYLPAANGEALGNEISKQVLAELDFVAELKNQAYFAEQFDGHPAIVVPKPVPELSTERVLVTEFLVGVPFRDALGYSRSHRNRIGEAIYRFYCGEMYRTGRFCADPHPGNVLVLDDGRVGFVDFGMCIRLRPVEHQFERDMFLAVLNGERERVHELAVLGGFIGRPDVMGTDDLTDLIERVVGWHLRDTEVEVTPDVARESVASAILPEGGFYDRFAGQRLQEAHALGRRTEMSTVALLGELRATASWRAIACEVLGVEAPATVMGREIAEWRVRRATSD